MGRESTLAKALYKGLLAAGMNIPTQGTLLVTVAAMAATPIVKGMKNMKHDCMGQSCNQSTVTKGEQIAYADPTIVRKGSYYYLTGTANQKPQGFSMLVSKDLKNWTSVGRLLTEGPQVYGNKGFWAPPQLLQKAMPVQLKVCFQ